MLHYNSYYYFLMMWDYVFDEKEMINILKKQLDLLEPTLEYYFQSMIDMKFNRLFNHFEIEFMTIRRNLKELKRINNFTTDIVKLIDKNITLIDKYTDDYNENYKDLNQNAVKSDLDLFNKETGLDISSFEILNYLIKTSYGKSVIDTLNLLIEQIHYNPLTDVLTSIHYFLNNKDTDEVLPFFTLIYIEEMVKRNDDTELQQMLDNYKNEEDELKSRDLVKELHLHIINKMLNDLYSIV